MQKKKLSIGNLKVKSFVTRTEGEVKAGREVSIETFTPTAATHCYICPPDEVFQ